MTDINKSLAALQHLIEVVAQLRNPEIGCPWDLAQTPETLIPYVLEEAYEVVDAIRGGKQNAIAEELGDLLLQVVLQSQIASEYQQFTLAEVVEGITQKLIRRHPHVFSNTEINSIEEVHQNWEQIKAAEKGQDIATTQSLTAKLERYARTLPPLISSMKISQKAATVGFEWENIDGVWGKFHEELAELQEALASEDKEHQEAELGDLLFSIIQVARWHDLDPFAALQGTNQRFIQRLSQVEKFADRPLSTYTQAELEALWQKAKSILS